MSSVLIGAVAGLTGAANQIIVTPGIGTITLSLPQSIGTGSSPVFAGLAITGLSGAVRANAGILTTGQIDLNSEVVGNLDIAHLNSGIGAGTATFWRGDGSWAAVTAAPAPFEIKTANYTAAAAERILADCTASAWTLTLPAAPSDTDPPITVKKVGAFALTIGLNGKNIRLSTGLVSNTDPTIDGTPGYDFVFAYRGTDASGQTDVWNY